MATGIPAGAVFVDVVPSFSGFPNALRNGLVGPSGNAGNEAGDAASNGILGKLTKLKGPLVAAVGALGIGAILTEAITSGMETEKVVDKLNASLGATGKDAAKYGKVAGDLYAGAYGESMGDVTDAVGAVLGSFSELRNGSEADLKAVTTAALDFAGAMGTDVSAAARAAGNVVKQGLATDATGAFDLLTAAAQKAGPTMVEPLLDASNEYAQFFTALGFDGETAFGALAAGAANGEIALDKVGDAVKEFTIRSTDMSTGSVAAYQTLGLSAQDMANDILAGGDRAQTATQQIVDGLLGIKDPATQANTAIALFGTPLEDLGVNKVPEFLESLKGTTGGLGEVEGAAARMGQTLNDNAATNIESAKRQLQQFATNTIGGVVIPKIDALASAVATGIGPVLGEVAGGFRAFAAAFSAADGDVTSSGFPGVMERIGFVAREVYDGITSAATGIASFVDEHRVALTVLAGAIGGAAVAFGAYYAVTQAIIALRYGVFLVQYAAQVGVVSLATKAWAGVQAFLNLVLSANPIGVVVVLLGALVGAIILAWHNSETFREVVLGAWSAVKDGVGAVVSWFTDTALPFVRGVFEGIGAAASWLYENVILPVWGGIKAYVEFVVGLVVGYIGLWIAAVTAIGDAVSWLYSNVIEPVFTLIRDVIRFAYEWVRDNVFTPLTTWLGTTLSKAFTAYRDLVLDVWEKVRAGVNAAYVWFRDNVFNPLVVFLRDTLSPAFDKARDVAVTAFGLLRDGVRDAYYWVRDNVFNPLKEFLVGTGSSVVSWFTKAKDDAGSAWDKIKGKVQEPIDWLGREVWGPLNTFLTSTLPGYFTSASNAIGTAWDAVKRAAALPVRFVVDTVINNGIVDTFNDIAKAVGSSAKLNRIVLPDSFPKFAVGGRVTGPGSGTSDDVPAWLSNGEYVVRASTVRKLGTGFMDALNAGRFASGGLIGAVTDPVGTVRGAVNNLLGKVPGGGAFRDIVLGLPTKILDLVVDKVKGFVGDLFGGGGDLGSGTGTGGWQWQMRVLREAFPGLPLNSGYRPGSITATGNLSYHARGRAVDVPPRADVFNWIRSHYGANTKELIFSPMGAAQLHNGKSHVYTGVTKAMHYNHVHWAYRNGGLVDQPLSYDRGGFLPPGVSTVFNGTRAPEPVFTRSQAAALTGGATSSEVVEALNRLANLAEVGNSGNVEGLDRVLAAVEASPRRSLALARQGVR